VALELRPYTPPDFDAWDTFCEDAFQATFLHSRRFLAYHGDRFRDLSLIIEAEGRLVGICPAAAHPADDTCVEESYIKAS
jgi:hypothetical protein